jgi:hypothetical protein
LRGIGAELERFSPIGELLSSFMVQLPARS